VYAKTGEATPLSGPAITVLGNTPFRVEMNISEVDVPKLARSQSGTLELDAFPGVKYQVRVSEIDSSPTLVDGVSKYRVKLDFLFPHTEFKIGMTGDVTVVTGERTDVVKVPSRAVSTKESGEKTVRILSGNTPEERVITTGMEGESGDIEVTSGLLGGEKVVVLQK
jgi:HlyD family secretion protein